MRQLVQAFVLGNGAILSNVCLLPLYPGLIAFLAGTGGGDARARRATPWLGLVMVIGFNPFARIATLRSPVFRSPFATAFAYGLLLGPMTLPCTGPIVVSAFPVGAGSVAMLSGPAHARFRCVARGDRRVRHVDRGAAQPLIVSRRTSRRPPTASRTFITGLA